MRVELDRPIALAHDNVGEPAGPRCSAQVAWITLRLLLVSLVAAVLARSTISAAEISADPVTGDASLLVMVGNARATAGRPGRMLRKVAKTSPRGARRALAQFVDGLGDEVSRGASVYGRGLQCLEHSDV